MTTTFNSPTPSNDPTPASSTEPTVVLEYNGKKYTQAELITKLTHGDQFIETLKTEREQDRKLLADAAEQLKTAVNSEELLKKLQTQNQSAPTPKATETPVDIEGTVAKVIADREVATTRAKNFEGVKLELQKAFGDKADMKVKEICAEVGMSFEQAIELAHTSPAAFKRFFPDLSKPAPKSGVPAGNVNTAAMNGKQEKPKSGYWEAKSGKDQVAAYLQRLKELSGE